jgi:hypothetical protein
MNTIRRHAILTTTAAGIAALAFAAPATAMGSGNPYQDLQVGVTYSVYQPTFTAGLKAQHVGGNLNCQAGTDQNLLGMYGRQNGRQFSITEGNPMCSDIGVGGAVLTTTINGAKATVYAYCDPSLGKKCTTSDVVKHGGHLTVILPAAGATLRPTTVWVETFGGNNLSAQQLVRVARGLKPVS